jgi:hypothetical protein
MKKLLISLFMFLFQFNLFAESSKTTKVDVNSILNNLECYLHSATENSKKKWIKFVDRPLSVGSLQRSAFISVPIKNKELQAKEPDLKLNSRYDVDLFPNVLIIGDDEYAIVKIYAQSIHQRSDNPNTGSYNSVLTLENTKDEKEVVAKISILDITEANGTIIECSIDSALLGPKIRIND